MFFVASKLNVVKVFRKIASILVGRINELVFLTIGQLIPVRYHFKYNYRLIS